jgi:hypothetical protein
MGVGLADLAAEQQTHALRAAVPDRVAPVRRFWRYAAL